MPGRNGPRKRNGANLRADGPQPVEASPRDEPHGTALVPFYGAPVIAPGIQAYRRGDIILYTVRGEPREVLELMGQLDQQGVGEVVALISHQAGEPAPPAGDEPVAE
jgi:hypothetical protein